MAIELINPIKGSDFKSQVEKGVDKNGDTFQTNVSLKLGGYPKTSMDAINKNYADGFLDYLYKEKPFFIKRDSYGNVEKTTAIDWDIKPILLKENNSACKLNLNGENLVYTIDFTNLNNDYIPYYISIKVQFSVEDTFVGISSWIYDQASFYTFQSYLKDEDGNVLASFIADKPNSVDYAGATEFRKGGNDYYLHDGMGWSLDAELSTGYVLSGKKLYVYLNNFSYWGTEDSTFYYNYPDWSSYARLYLSSISGACETKYKPTFS